MTNAKFLKSWLMTILSSAMTTLLLITAKDYPCLKGAGLALADFEAFVLSVFIALPCFAWAVIKLRSKAKVGQVHSGDIWAYRAALYTVIGSVIFLAIAIPVVLSITPHYLQTICVAKYLWTPPVLQGED